MNEEQNTQLVKNAYERFRAGDIPGVLALLADDVEWQLDETENVPFSGMRHGKDQVEHFFSVLDKTQAALQFDPRQFIAQDDTVIALGHYAWSVKATDRVFESDWAHVFTIREGKVTRFREFTDTAAAAAAHKAG